MTSFLVKSCVCALAAGRDDHCADVGAERPAISACWGKDGDAHTKFDRELLTAPLLYRLRQLFAYYCTYGERLNVGSRAALSRVQVVRLLADSGILNTLKIRQRVDILLAANGVRFRRLGFGDLVDLLASVATNASHVGRHHQNHRRLALHDLIACKIFQAETTARRHGACAYSSWPVDCAHLCNQNPMTTGIIRFSKFDFDAVSDNLNADARRIVGTLSTAMIKITEHDARIEESLTSNVGKLIQPLAQLSTPMNVMVHIAGTNLEVTTISPSAQSLDSRRTWEPDAKSTASEVDDSCIWTSSLIAAMSTCRAILLAYKYVRDATTCAHLPTYELAVLSRGTRTSPEPLLQIKNLTGSVSRSAARVTGISPGANRELLLAPQEPNGAHDTSISVGREPRGSREHISRMRFARSTPRVKCAHHT